MSLLSIRTASSGNLIAQRARIYGVWFLGGSTAGSVSFSDSATTGGTERLRIDTPGITTSGTTSSGMVQIPDDSGRGGIEFQNGVAVSLSIAAACTIFYTLA